MVELMAFVFMLAVLTSVSVELKQQDKMRYDGRHQTVIPGTLLNSICE
jgi:hypothetical protein